jgi:hypothetical protein
VSKRSEYRVAASELRATGDRLQDRQALRPVLREFDEIAHARHRAMMEMFRQHRKSVPTPVARGLLGQVLGQTSTLLTKAVSRVLAATSRATVVESGRAAEKFVGRMFGNANRLEDPAYMQRLVSAHEHGVALARQNAFTGVRDAMNRKFGVIVANIGKDMTVGDLLDQADDLTDGSRWMFERVAKTEASAAYNRVQDAVITDIAGELPGMRKRWVELVSDLTGTPLDARVAKDSLVLHGQLTKPGGSFTMPPDERAPSKLVGKTWSAPPNRPHDRAIVTAWMPGWGVPGWVWNGGRVLQL